MEEKYSAFFAQGRGRFYETMSGEMHFEPHSGKKSASVGGEVLLASGRRSFACEISGMCTEIDRLPILTFETRPLTPIGKLDLPSRLYQFRKLTPEAGVNIKGEWAGLAKDDYRTAATSQDDWMLYNDVWIPLDEDKIIASEKYFILEFCDEPKI
ncbi:hypothetical protein KAR91_36420 [Candidatus Pacearchaeota archaeon]|nr:hypothetical protein [Candidatus Pacearchaeota archaeon]